MADILELIDGLQTDLAMQINSKRLESFKDWPFQSDCNCTPSAMAEAGFYYCPTDVTPDQVRCFACGQELESWEPQDVPWEEHAIHSEKCPWVEMKQQESNGTKATLSQMNKVSSFILRRWSGSLLNDIKMQREMNRKAYKELAMATINRK